MSLLGGTLAGSGCHRSYDVRGDLVINPGSAAVAVLPALLCTGRGGPPVSSGMYAQPVGYVLCRRPTEPVRVPYKDGVYYGSVPHRMHIYGFTEAAPDAQALCDSQPNSTVLLAPGPEWIGYRRCFERNEPNRDMAFVVTFDDSKGRSWSEEGGTWTEVRDIVLR